MKEPWHRLRWKMCKIWSVPPTHEIFSSLTLHQWLWCTKMLEQDRTENFEMTRNLLEYQISFMPEANDSVRNAMEKRNSSGVVGENQEDNFQNTLKQWFGRELDEVKFSPEKK